METDGNLSSTPRTASQAMRGVLTASQARHRRAAELCGKGENQAEVLLLIQNLSGWRLHWEYIANAQVSKELVVITARSSVKQEGKYDMVQVMNSLS